MLSPKYGSTNKPARSSAGCTWMGISNHPHFLSTTRWPITASLITRNFFCRPKNVRDRPNNLMANNSPTDYKKLFLQAKERQRQAEERVKQETERRKEETERRKQAEEREKNAKDKERQERERNQQTTFVELLRFCHSLLSRSLGVQSPSRSTTGNIPLPTGKYCPMRLALWTDCSAQQQNIFSSVCNYLQPTEEA